MHVDRYFFPVEVAGNSRMRQKYREKKSRKTLNMSAHKNKLTNKKPLSFKLTQPLACWNFKTSTASSSFLVTC